MESVTQPTFPAESTTLREFSAPGHNYWVTPPSSHPILAAGFEIHPSLFALVRSQSFSRHKDENPYTHLRDFEQNCSIIVIPGMHHETVKWKLFPFSLTSVAKKWYYMTVRTVKSDWNTLKDEFCLKFFPISKVVALRTKALSFKQ